LRRPKLSTPLKEVQHLEEEEEEEEMGRVLLNFFFLMLIFPQYPHPLHTIRKD
jgi:hypothetical protein